MSGIRKTMCLVWLLLLVSLFVPQAAQATDQLDAENALGQAAMFGDMAGIEWSNSLTAQITAWNDYDDVNDYYWNMHVNLVGRDQEIEDLLLSALGHIYSGDSEFDDGNWHVDQGDECMVNAETHYTNQLWTMCVFAADTAMGFYIDAYNEYTASQTHHNEAISICDEISGMLEPI